MLFIHLGILFLLSTDKHSQCRTLFFLTTNRRFTALNKSENNAGATAEIIWCPIFLPNSRGPIIPVMVLCDPAHSFPHAKITQWKTSVHRVPGFLINKQLLLLIKLQIAWKKITVAWGWNRSKINFLFGFRRRGALRNKKWQERNVSLSKTIYNKTMLPFGVSRGYLISSIFFLEREKSKRVLVFEVHTC